MSVPQKGSFPKLEVRIGNYLLKTVSDNEAIFKDIRVGSVHYSAYFTESSLVFHKTIEGQHRIHTPIGEVAVDWKSFMDSLLLGIKAEWETIFQTVNVHNPRWSNLEVDYLTIEKLQGLALPTRRGYMLLNDKHLEKLLSAIEVSRLNDLAEHGCSVGTGSGYFVLNYGDKGLLFNTERFSEIFQKGLHAHLGKMRLTI